MAKPTKKVTNKPRNETDDKQKALENALKHIEKQFGKGTVMRLGDQAKMNVEVIPTGSLALDIALGVGGVPRGRIIEIYGPESSGKTTVALHMVAEAQKLGGEAAFIDVEHALDPSYAEVIGVDTKTLLVSQPDTGEQALEIVEALISSNAIDIIVIDSVAAMLPRVELEGEMGDSHVGLQARLMSQALRKLTGVISRSKCVAIFINQLREKVGVMYGSPEVTPGGRALKFYSSVRLDIRRVERLKDGSDFIGNRTRIKVVKNKVAPPFKEAEFDMMFGEGISPQGEILDMGVEFDVVTKGGSWYSYGETRLGQGRDNAKTYFMENPELFAEVKEKVRLAAIEAEAEGRRTKKKKTGGKKEEAEADVDDTSKEDDSDEAKKAEKPAKTDKADKIDAGEAEQETEVESEETAKA